LTSPSQSEAQAAAERRLARLAYDLHDGPLQELVFIAQELRLAADQIAGVVPEEYRDRVRGRFQDIESRLATLEESLREIAQGGRSASSVAREPIEETIRAELAAVEAKGIAAEFDTEGEFDELSDSQKIVLLRVVQEGLTNVWKHSGARSVAVTLRRTPDGTTELTIRDDGRGFDAASVGRDRIGLAGVLDRVNLLGGEANVESSPNNGATLRARLPQWQPPQDAEN